MTGVINACLCVARRQATTHRQAADRPPYKYLKRKFLSSKLLNILSEKEFPLNLE